MNEKPGSRFYLGLDLGQARDYSAIAIAERRVQLTGAYDHLTFERHTRTRVIVNHLERIPLRTPYPDVVARVRNLVQRYTGHSMQVIVDATGVGAAVRDMLAAARLSVQVIGVTLTGGERVNITYGTHHVPRHDLLANLRVLLEKGMLEIAVPAAIGELLRTEFMRWGARSAHDDLVFAVALACWKAGGQPIPASAPAPLPLVYPEMRP